MSYIADFHIHSRYSYATSKHSCLEKLHFWSGIKGIQLLGTGDFTHPAWLKELKQKLIEDGNGFYRLKKTYTESDKDVRFILTSEISCIYKNNNQTKKSHHLLVVPDFKSVEKIVEQLAKIGNIASDGRPILKLSARNLLEILLESSPAGFLIPAHIWTPWFSIFGSRSGYDTITDCFEDLTEYIFCLETGLSSDPNMIRHISDLDRFTLVSNSDCHSPENLGREANIIYSDFDFLSLKEAIQFPNEKNHVHTIEFFPEEGKYFLSGHKNCNFRIIQDLSKKPVQTCPECHRPLTIGVWNRVMELSDRKSPVYNAFEKFKSIIPLKEILSEITGVGPKSKTVDRLYQKLIDIYGSEFNVLLGESTDSINNCKIPMLAEAINRMRNHQIIKTPGYDGLYGNIKLFRKQELKAKFGKKC